MSNYPIPGLSYEEKLAKEVRSTVALINAGGGSQRLYQCCQCLEETTDPVPAPAVGYLCAPCAARNEGAK